MITPKPLHFKYGSARAKLYQLESDLFALSDLWSEERGKGHATKVLQQIVDFADMERVTIKLIVQPYGHPIATSLDNRKLEGFYQRFGFERDEGGNPPPYTMTRYPSREKHAP